MVLLLLIDCLLLPPVFVRVWGLVLVLLCSTYNVTSSFAIISLRKRELVAALAVVSLFNFTVSTGLDKQFLA